MPAIVWNRLYSDTPDFMCAAVKCNGSTYRRYRAVLKAGLAHAWLVRIHPFDDGNERIARAMGDMDVGPV